MAVLTHRAEQALLGAMLLQPGLAAMLDHVETGDFLAREHRVLHAVLVTASGSWDGNGSWRDAVAAAAGPEIRPEYLGELEAACPDPMHGRAYAALVVEAYARRMLLEESEDLAQQAESLKYDTGRLRRAGGTGGVESTVLAEHTARVARAFRGFGLQFTPDAVVAPVVAPPGSVGGRPADEELVLGALIGGHRETRRVLGFLVPDAFGDPVRRAIYAAVRTLYLAGGGIDPLTVDWELARRQPVLAGEQAPVTGDLPSYVTRLATAAAGTDRIEGVAYALTEDSSRAVGRPGPAAGIAGGARLQGPAGCPGAVNGAAPLVVQRPPGASVNGRTHGQGM